MTNFGCRSGTCTPNPNLVDLRSGTPVQVRAGLGPDHYEYKCTHVMIIYLLAGEFAFERLSRAPYKTEFPRILWIARCPLVVLTSSALLR